MHYLKTACLAGLAGLISARAGILTDTDFNAGTSWPGLTAYTAGSSLSASVVITNNGTIDPPMGITGGAATLSVDASGASGVWSAGLASGPLPVSNQELHLGKLTVSFDLWTSLVCPVRVRIQSFTTPSAVAPTGTRETVVFPPVAGSYYRHALDLSTMVSVGAGTFDPLAPFIQLQLEINSSDSTEPWPAQAGLSIRVDNLSYTSPAYYVSTAGSNSHTGRTETLAFATIQKAVDAAQPGDVIMVSAGSYANASDYRGIRIEKAGTPSRWIVLRAHPDGSPAQVLSHPANWSACRMNHKAAYIEIRGLVWRGNRANVNLAGAEADYESSGGGSPAYNGNGIDVVGGGGSGTDRPHHIRVIGNRIHEMSGGGSGASNADYLTWEGNIIHGNCWYMRYAGSGISYLGLVDVDGTTTTSPPVHKSFIIGNIVYRNQCFVRWKQNGNYSDGNGIILDSYDDLNYAGRTLVQNNVSLGNGGSGIHAFRGRRVDIANNTAYYNGQTPQTRYGQIFAQRTNDARITNNILWSQAGNPINSVSHSIDRNNVGVVFTNNLFYGDGSNFIDNSNPANGANTPLKPLFAQRPKLAGSSPAPDVNADIGAFDFRLIAGSPGIDTGSSTVVGVPRVDLTGRHRPLDSGIDPGAYEYVINTPPAITVHPIAMTSLAGSSAFFSVRATGDRLTYQWGRAGAPIAGATGASLYLGNVGALDAGTYSVAITNELGAVISAPALLSVAATGSVRLINLSARAQVGTGGNILIPGFVVHGVGNKSLLIRAVGPRLMDFGVGGVLTDPRLQVVPLGTQTIVAENDDWADASNGVEMERVRRVVGAFSFGASMRDASLLVALQPGPYTAPTAGVGNGDGVGLVELYDADASNSLSELVNISARAQVGTGSDVLITGFIIQGDVSMTLLLRAVGPHLAGFSLVGVLADPTMTIHRVLPGGGSESIAFNDHWEDNPNASALAGASASTGAFPLPSGSRDAALLIAMNPGAYTVTVAGANTGTGIALVELYRVGP